MCFFIIVGGYISYMNNAKVVMLYYVIIDGKNLSESGKLNFRVTYRFP